MNESENPTPKKPSKQNHHRRKSERFNPDNVPIIEVHDHESYKARQRQQSHLFPPNKYRGMVYCGICGAPISYYRSNTAGVNPYEIYRCSNRKVWKYGEAACPREDIPVEELDKLVESEIQRERSYALALSTEMDKRPDSLLTKVLACYQDETEKRYQPIRTCNKKQFDEFVRWQNGEISEEEYSLLREEILKDEAIFQENWKEVQYYYARVQQYFSPKNTWIRTMVNLPEDYVPTKEELKRLVFRIYIYEDNRVEIIWRSNLMRERLYNYLSQINALPDGFTNPPHQGCPDPGLYAYSKEELAKIHELGFTEYQKLKEATDEAESAEDL